MLPQHSTKDNNACELRAASSLGTSYFNRGKKLWEKVECSRILGGYLFGGDVDQSAKY